VTLRLPLGTLFDGRDYVFVTESNVRGYEWTMKEADILMDDLTDAALGNMGVEGSSSAPSSPLLADYELSQIVLVPTADWDSSRLGLGNRYDVYDGQQRLVTLNLLLAGLRDSFRREADELSANDKEGTGGGKRAVALAATAQEISGMLMPARVRKEDVARMTLRRRDNVLLEKIAIGDTDGDGSGGEGSSSSSPPVRDYSGMSARQRSDLLSPLSSANARIFHNFVHLLDRLASLTTRERLRLLDYIVERVHLLVCIPETSRIARNIVMSQGRKGMDNEPIDDFKGLVCFRYTLEEGDMYQVFDRWDSLAAEPSSRPSTDVDPSGEDITPVGRDIVSSACQLRASAALRTKIRSRGGDEVYEWERWLRQEMWARNQRRSEQLGSDIGQEKSTSVRQPWQGKDFFDEEIKPASAALYKFRTGQWDEFYFLSKTGAKKNMTKKQRDTTVARLNFLRDITIGVTSAKEAEIVVLELLLRAEDAGADSSNSNHMLSRYLDEILPLIEKWSLWMALTRPSPMKRHARVFALLDAMDDVDAVGSLGLEMSSPGDDGNGTIGSLLRERMDEYEFGTTAGGKRLAAAILKRMNAYLMVEEKKVVPSGKGAPTVEIIQHHLTSDDALDELAYRIGNLALVSKAPPRDSGRRKNKHDSSYWENKSRRYKKEPWLLTRQLSELDKWDLDAMQDQQKDLVSLMDLVWSLET